MTRTIRSPAAPGRSRIYEKLIRDTARVERCESIADLVAAVKARCARLRIPYGRHELDDAFAAMGDDVCALLVPARTVHPVTPPPPAPLSHGEAVALLARVRAQCGMPAAAPKVIPAARPLTLREDDRRRALRIVAQAIRDQAQRCDDVERAVPEQLSEPPA